MKRIALLLILCAALPGQAHAQGGMMPGPGTVHSTAAPYSGPGDIVSGAILDVSVRAYNAAYATGSNAAATLRRASDNTTQTINILSNGNYDAATAATFCAATSCFWTTGTDQSGSGNNCSEGTTAFQPAAITSSGPFAGYSASFGFSGTQFLECGSIVSGTFTYIVQFLPTSFAVNTPLVGMGPAGGGPGFYVLTNGKLQFDKTNTAAIGTSTGTLTLSTWACVALSYNGSTGAWVFYINGTASGSGTNVQSFGADHMWIGNIAGNPTGNGNIAEVLIYNSVLTGTQINNICNSTSP